MLLKNDPRLISAQKNTSVRTIFIYLKGISF